MFHLTREVRHFSHGRFRTVQATLAALPDPHSGYVMDIKAIDHGVRSAAGPILDGESLTAHAALDLFHLLTRLWNQLDVLKIGITPYTSLSVRKKEQPMVRFSQKYEFSAAHRLHNPALSPAQNAALFGKCNNPHGHGHNYELEVTLRGQPKASGFLAGQEHLDETVTQTVLQRFDHKFLNIETAEFKDTNPTVENIAQTIYKLLKAALTARGGNLAEVTVWETPKTWCRYEEES